MIAHVQGHIVEKFNGTVIVDVHGLGYEVQVPAGDYDALLLNDESKLYTYHHVREQAEELYGFSTLAAKKLFELLITVQGVGPKAALAILSIDAVEVVRNGIANADATLIAKASGVGKKTAERVVVDLSDKVGVAIHYKTQGLALPAQQAMNDEALEALMALGFSLADASKSLESVPDDLSTEERITLALRQGR